jgi:hypothetical protein
MNAPQGHANYLKDLFAELTAAGLTGIRIADSDLDPLTLDEHGAEAVIAEMFAVDEVNLRAEYLCAKDGEPDRMILVFILSNDPWELLADHSMLCEEEDEKLSEILNRLSEKYEP